MTPLPIGGNTNILPGPEVHCVELALVREGASLAMDSLKFKDILGFGN